MPIPDFQTLMLPLLQAVSDGLPHTSRDLATRLAEQMQLTREEIDRRLPSGNQRVFTNRIAWAKSYLQRAGLIKSPSRGLSQITETGRSALETPPDRITISYLKQFPSFDWGNFRKAPDNHAAEESDSAVTPLELFESSYNTLREQLASELLERVRTCSPSFSETLVVRLLVSMGYGGSLADAGHAIGRSGDGGIDGIIKEDKLGLDIVCIQAKRWEGSVGRPVVQAFAGSMEGFRARKGVLITTSAFSKEATDYINRIERKIVLIDGEALVQFMIDHDIGVTPLQFYAVKRVDSDYFMEDDTVV